MKDFLEWIVAVEVSFPQSLFLTQAHWQWQESELSFQIHSSEQRGWLITAQHCTEHRIELGYLRDAPNFRKDYPRLKVANMPTRQLTFSAAPPRPEQMLLDLRAVHDETQWGRFGRYGLGRNLSFGAGVFADGPEPLLELYHPVLAAHEMRPAWLGDARPPQSAPRECLALGYGAVWQDDAYVLADGFTAQRLEGEGSLR